MPGIEPDVRRWMWIRGNLRLGICLDCHMNMSIPGMEMVNDRVMGTVYQVAVVSDDRVWRVKGKSVSKA